MVSNPRLVAHPLYHSLFYSSPPRFQHGFPTNVWHITHPQHTDTTQKINTHHTPYSSQYHPNCNSYCILVILPFHPHPIYRFLVTANASVIDNLNGAQIMFVLDKINGISEEPANRLIDYHHYVGFHAAMAKLSLYVEYCVYYYIVIQIDFRND